MNFTDGNWMMQPGITAHYGAEVYQVKVRENVLELLVPTRKINHRGDTLGGPTLDVTLTAPAQDVIAINIKHFRGGSPDAARFREFEPSEAEVIQAEKLIGFTSGNLTAEIDRGSFSLNFSSNGKKVSSIPSRGCGLMSVEGTGNHIVAQLTLGVGELVYGLGERFTAFAKNGQTVDIWNEDGGTCSYQAYKNIPFYMTNQGYGVFVNHTGRVSFEVATERTS
ncbi:MAG: alpha-xylosidase, partial [Armatimonadetes bacterium Cent15-Ar3]